MLRFLGIIKQERRLGIMLVSHDKNVTMKKRIAKKSMLSKRTVFFKTAKDSDVCLAISKVSAKYSDMLSRLSR